MITPSERSLHPNGGSTAVSHETHEPGQERHPTEIDNASSFALRSNGNERASMAPHPGENDYDPVQSSYAPKKEPAQPAVEGDFAVSEDAAHRTSEGLREHLEPCACDIHEPSLFSHCDGGQQELEQSASVRSIQREAAAARLPHAAQLTSVPGRSLVDDGFSPPRSLETEDLADLPAMGSRPDSLRGPRTIIKIITLIVSVFAVPVAYYFWVGDWTPTSNPPLERASVISNSIVAPPNPSSEAATSIVRNDDPGTPIKDEPQTAKSFAGETVATLQAGAPGAEDAPSSTAVRLLDPEQIKLLIKKGEQFIAEGDMVTARLALQRAAEAGDASAAVALGATYDPTVLAGFGVVGISADVAEARSWYRKAEKLGSLEARQRLEALADR